MPPFSFQRSLALPPAFHKMNSTRFPRITPLRFDQLEMPICTLSEVHVQSKTSKSNTEEPSTTQIADLPRNGEHSLFL